METKEKELKVLEEKESDMDKDVLKLTSPIEIDGKEVTEIKYNLNRITGKTIRVNIQKLGRMEMVVPNIEFSPVLHAALFAEAAELDFHIIEKLNVKDYTNAVSIVSNFM